MDELSVAFHTALTMGSGDPFMRSELGGRRFLGADVSAKACRRRHMSAPALPHSVGTTRVGAVGAVGPKEKSIGEGLGGEVRSWTGGVDTPDTEHHLESVHRTTEIERSHQGGQNLKIAEGVCRSDSADGWQMSQFGCVARR